LASNLARRPRRSGRAARLAPITLALVLAACAPAAPAPAPTGSSPGAPAAASPAPAGASSAPPPAAAAPPPKEKVRIAYVSQGATIGVIDLVKQSGMFDRYGIDADLTLIRTPLSVSAMISGEVDMNFIAAQPILSSNLEGADTVLVSCGIDKAFWWIMSKPSLTRPQDLKGMRVANSRPGSNLYEVFNLALPRWGLTPDDVKLVLIDNNQDKLVALQTDIADAAVISVPFNVEAAKLGFRQLVDVGELGISWPASCLATTHRFIAARPAALKGVLQAYIATSQWMKTHRPEAVEMLMRFTETDDREVIEDAFTTVLKYQDDVPYPSRRGIETILQFLPNAAAAGASPDRFVDDRVVRELDQAGFIKAVMQ
jgi:ABC-type nitrate/sulfonate/bicarbonate transport system substrate-binding protein